MNLKQTATIVTTGGALAAWLVGGATTNHTVAPAPIVQRSPVDAKSVVTLAVRASSPDSSEAAALAANSDSHGACRAGRSAEATAWPPLRRVSASMN